MSIEYIKVFPASESQERAAKLLPAQGSEDRSSLLARPDFPDLDDGEDDDAVPESPENPLGWTLYLELPNQGGVAAASILEVLNFDWRWNHSRPDIYGADGEEPWIHLAACEEDHLFSKLAVTFSMVDDRDGWEIPSAESLEGYRQDLEKALQAFGGKVVAQTMSSRDAAVEIPKKFKEASDAAVFIVVDTPEGQLFDGRDIWDVMLCLGLEWGDMDLFHWRNPEPVGDNSLFHVWTSTQPGYFLPEWIAAGKLRTHDLVFQLPVARCAVSEQVFDSMLRAATYTAQRLGGRLTDLKRKPFDEKSARAELAADVARIRSLGFEPGAGRALRLL
jgi:cell division protein ZipA